MTTFPLPTRHATWTTPAGEDVEAGQIVRVKGEPGRFKFLAYVDALHPHVEAVRTKGPASIRCFRPERVVQVLKETGAPNRLRARRKATT